MPSTEHELLLIVAAACLTMARALRHVRITVHIEWRRNR